jgi:serine/threonine protein kinase
MSVETAREPVGRVGEFEILKRLATSDLSTTYMARHAVTGELAAIKVAAQGVVQSPVLLKRFDHEYTLTRGLDYPNLVRALSRGYHGELPYIVLEYVDGPLLGDRIAKEGRLPADEAVEIITQVGQALHFAHRHRIIHRDVKPDNILLGADGIAKLADLGLAKDYELDVALTRPNSGLGTPNFMAPEQFRDASHADRRCDIYSLGATLYMAVMGELPFAARGIMSVLKKKFDGDLPRPRQLVPELSPHIEAAILRALSINPKARQASCSEFLDELHGRGALAPARSSASAKTIGVYEKRATARYASQQDGFCQTLQGKKAGCWEAVIRDVSADGMGLILGRRFEPRTVLVLELNPTADLPARRVLVRVVRAAPLPPGRWLLGCDFGVRLNEDEVNSLL